MKWAEFLAFVVLLWIYIPLHFFAWRSPQKSSRLEVWAAGTLLLLELLLAILATAALLFSLMW
jgi:hypothetical protein